MASAIDTANPDHPLQRAHRGPATDNRAAQARPNRKGGWSLGSRLGRTIILLNLLGLGILVAGALILNEMRQGLVNARAESLAVEGQLVANAIDQSATVGEPAPMLQAGVARRVLQSLDIPPTERARLYDPQGRLLADSYQVADRVERRPLPPARRPGQRTSRFSFGVLLAPAARAKESRLALAREVAAALAGDAVRDVRIGEEGGRVVSVSVPIKRVRAVLGVLTLEAGDVDSIILHEREALIPFILIAVGVALLSSLVLTQFIAVPVLRLARAADRVRLSRARAIALPDLAERDDELGDLTRSLEAMTATLADRMLAIERFAADVSHELRNPMTSIRSAVETLDLVKTDAQRARLIAILNHDVGRLDRLITDISNASRLDAELSRNAPAPMDLARLLSDISDFYTATSKPGDPRVTFIGPPTPEPMMVVGREGPLGQVFRNLVDNARSFSPPGGEVRVFVSRNRGEVLARVEDDGPGIPPDNLETVFERFYTSRPKGAAFGGNSGLGLAIARQIIETHGGRIWAENRREGDRVVGASFRVALPIA
jgi:two-component system sensor histidine kinase ChvG